MNKIRIQNSDDIFECSDDDTILRAALRSGYGMMYSCNVGSCGNCKFELIEGQVTHNRIDSPAWSERDLKRNKWLGCQARPDGPCTIKFRADPGHISENRPIRRKVKLLKVTPITHDVREFSFNIDDDDAFQAGQYSLLTVPGVTGSRAYSMCNLPGQNIWNFQIKNVPGGAATSRLFDMEPGVEVELDGPYGTAYLDEESPRDIILMGGGSGLSPMVSIARRADGAGLLADRKLHFYYGCRGEADMIDPAMIDADFADKMTFTTALSEQPPADANCRHGFLHDIVQADFGDALKDHEIYFAGPAIMSTAIQKMAYEAGVPTDQLHFDEFY